MFWSRATLAVPQGRRRIVLARAMRSQANVALLIGGVGDPPRVPQLGAVADGI